MAKARHLVNNWLQTLDNRFSLDESGRCFLQQDEQTGIVLYAPEQGDEVFIYSDLMRVPDDIPTGFYEQVLALNSHTAKTGGASITFEPSSNQLLAILSQPIQALDGMTFQNIIKNIPALVGSLRAQLNKIWVDCKNDLAISTDMAPLARA